MSAADQQVLAAWVSAGAAVVQAIGAIAAIVASIVLARSSAQREAEAEQKAALREELAERKAQEREERALQAADERRLLAEAKARNSLVDRVVSLAKTVAADAQGIVDEVRVRYSVVKPHIRGGLQVDLVDDLHALIRSVLSQTGDLDLITALRGLESSLEFQEVGGVAADDYISHIQDEVFALNDAIERVAGLKILGRSVNQ